jgi:hypothetical protein
LADEHFAAAAADHATDVGVHVAVRVAGGRGCPAGDVMIASARPE